MVFLVIFGCPTDDLSIKIVLFLVLWFRERRGSILGAVFPDKVVQRRMTRRLLLKKMTQRRYLNGFEGIELFFKSSTVGGEDNEDVQEY